MQPDVSAAGCHTVSSAGSSPMAHVHIDIVSACNRKICTTVIPRHEYGPTVEGVYTGLESNYREEGHLTDSTGRCLGRAGRRFLDAGTYTFALKGKPANSRGEGPQLELAQCG